MHPDDEKRWNEVNDKIETLQKQVAILTSALEAIKSYKIDRHISYDCSRGNCRRCKGRTCRHNCHQQKIDKVDGEINVQSSSVEDFPISQEGVKSMEIVENKI